MANNHPQKNNPKPTFVSLEQSWSGPLPPPQVLAQFEQAHPGSGENYYGFFSRTIKTQKRA